MKVFSLVLGVAMLVTAWAESPTVVALERRLAARDAAIDRDWAALADREAIESRAAAFKARLRQALGWRRDSAPLNVRKFVAKDYGDIRLESVIFESAPGQYVAALVFLPDTRRFAPPYAGFVFIPGHSRLGKRDPSYLNTCALAARNGLAAITYDPIGQGERVQGAGVTGAAEHALIGAYAVLLGETTATYMLRDARRALDYFAARDDIDATRLGACGNSGGGTMTALLMVADDRIRAAVPSCCLSSAREQLLACGPQDAEQNFFDEFGWGFNHASLILSANGPVLVNAAANDFFPIAGTRSTFALVKSVAAKAGWEGGRLALAVSPGTHGMSKAHREHAVRFLLAHLQGEVQAFRSEAPIDFEEKDVTVTTGGSVAKMAGFRSIYEELAERFAREGVSVAQAATNAIEQVRRELARGEFPGERYEPCKERRGKVSFYERRNDEEVVAVEYYLGGRSLVAAKAAALIAKAKRYRQRAGRRFELTASGARAVEAQFAQVAAPEEFGEVRLTAPIDFIAALEKREYLRFADSGALYSGRLSKKTKIKEKYHEHQ